MDKRYIAIALCTLLLASCGAEGEQESVTVSITAEETAPAGVTEPAQTTKKLLADYTVTAAETTSQTTVSVTESADIEDDVTTYKFAEQFGEDDHLRVKNHISRALDGCFLLSFNIMTGSGENATFTDTVCRFVDADTPETRLEFANGFDEVSCGSGDVLCRLYSEDDDSGKITTYTVYKDFTYDTAEGDNMSFSHYGRDIEYIYPDLLYNGEVIVPGYIDTETEWGFYSTSEYYEFAIDENRFVYYTRGYERLPGFGIYDFETGEARDVPDSKDKIPFGYADGKIYSYGAYWDGWDTTLYVTDPVTLETTLLTDFPYELDKNRYIEYSMPVGGDYILCFEPCTYDNGVSRAYIINLSGEIIAEYEYGEDKAYDFAFAAADKVLIGSQSKGGTEILNVSLDELVKSEE